MTRTQSSRLALVTALLAPLLGAGCIFVAAPSPGDITFLWSFDGEPDCFNARVADLDVFVFEGNTLVREEAMLDCSGGGLTLENFDAGTYTVQVDAYNSRGLLLYTGEETATVENGATADLGVLELFRAGEGGKGDLGFNWSFDGTATCQAAGVAEIDVDLIDANGAVVLDVTEACYGGGLVLNNLDPGSYTLYVDAFAADNTYLFAGRADVTVTAGTLSDIGVLLLDSVADMDATLRFDVGFLYPASSAETSCSVAGVVAVDIVFIDGPNGPSIRRESVNCNTNGLGLDIPVGAGTHHFYLEAFGVVMGNDVLLYDTADMTASVTSGNIQDLGLIALERVSGNFADIRIEHDLPAGQTCGSIGVTNFDYSITRLTGGANLVDDMGTLACTDTFLLRQTFVPGSYRVDVSASGTGGSYVGTVTIDAVAGGSTTADVDIVLDN